MSEKVDEDDDEAWKEACATVLHIERLRILGREAHASEAKTQRPNMGNPFRVVEVEHHQRNDSPCVSRATQVPSSSWQVDRGQEQGGHLGRFVLSFTCLERLPHESSSFFAALDLVSDLVIQARFSRAQRGARLHTRWPFKNPTFAGDVRHLLVECRHLPGGWQRGHRIANMVPTTPFQLFRPV